jgi:hypothetical protein
MDLAKEPADYYPDQLSGRPGAVRLPPRRALLVGLVLFTMAIELWMAARWRVLWPDTVDYLRVSQALEQGDPRPLIHQFGPNLYPLVLVELHRAGLDWLRGGQGWSILLASLTVLPLFGWLRRQFDDQVAFVACLLYALHPKLMLHGPLIIRDPTFWFLMVLTLYLGWRAVLELTLWLFLAAGIAWGAAAYTRTEGLLLAAPLGLWCLFRWPAAAARQRLLLGAVAGAAMLPAWIVLMNVTLLHGYPHWVTFRQDYFEMLQGSPSSHEMILPPGPQDTSPPPARGFGPILQTAGATALKIPARLVHAFTWSYACLVVLGLWLWRRVFFRRDQLAMLPFHLLLWLLIGWRLAAVPVSDDRYYLPSVIVTTPCAALGLLAIARWLARLTAARVAWSPPRRAALVGGLLLAFVLIGTHDRSLRRREWMCHSKDLGQWIAKHCGPRPRFAGGPSEMRLVAYYAQADEAPNFNRYSYRGKSLLWTIEQLKPDVLLLWDKDKDRGESPGWRKLLEEHAELGLCCVPSDQLPASCRNVAGDAGEDVKELVLAVRKELLAKPPATVQAAQR